MEKCFQKGPFSFHGVAYVQEVKSWDFMGFDVKT